MKRPALQKRRVGILRMAFRARKVFGTFEKRVLGSPFVRKSINANPGLTVNRSFNLAR